MGSDVTKTMKWISHEGHEILLADYCNLRGEALVDAIRANRDAIVAIGQKGRSDLLILTDVRLATIGPEVLAAFKDVAKTMKPYTAASAVVGITAARKFLLQAVNMFSSMSIEPIKTLDGAKAWLVSQART